MDVAPSGVIGERKEDDMAAFDPATLDRWRALAIVDRDGTTVGTISEFYLDRESGEPTWALVETGLFGATRTFVPLVHAVEVADGLQVPYEKGHIKDAPRVDLHDELTPDEEATLFAHYGVDYQPSTSPGPAEAPGPVPPDAVDQGPGSAATAPELAPEGPGPVPAEPGSIESSDNAQPGRSGSPPGDPDPLDPAVPGEPTDADPAGAGALGRDEAPDPVPAEPGTTDSAEAGRSERRWAGPTAVRGDEDPADGDPDPSRPAPVDGGPDLSRPAPVEPRLPGSTAATPTSVTTAADRGAPADPSARPADDDEATLAPGEVRWAPGRLGGFEEQEPAGRPSGASDRWREAKLAAERERVARMAAAQQEERGPLERARRRLERLVGGGQNHTDPEGASPADRDAAERARRARLGLDEDDPRSR